MNPILYKDYKIQWIYKDIIINSQKYGSLSQLQKNLIFKHWEYCLKELNKFKKLPKEHDFSVFFVLF